MAGPTPAYGSGPRSVRQGHLGLRREVGFFGAATPGAFSQNPFTSKWVENCCAASGYFAGGDPVFMVELVLAVRSNRLVCEAARGEICCGRVKKGEMVR